MDGKDSLLIPIFQLILGIFTNMKKSRYSVIGVMSGTSLDGIDLVFTELDFSNKLNYKIIASQTISYPEDWRRRLSSGIDLDSHSLEKLDQEYTYYLAKVILKFVNRHELEHIDAICSHGHTIKHRPADGVTLQIGNLPELAKLLGLLVVCDFRVQDVKLGGQGAPLVPIGDKLLFSHYKYCINLGGFANISLEHNDQRIAYDICAVNTVFNHYMLQTGKEYDENGNLARSGKLHEELLRALNSLHYFGMKPPKSLGLEWVKSEVIPLINSYQLEIPDIMRTFTEHVAYQISQSLDDERESDVLLTGGGTYNLFLVERMKAASNCRFRIPEDELINLKEALIFALLGVLKLREEINVLSSVTGAKKDHSSGRIFRP